MCVCVSGDGIVSAKTSSLIGAEPASLLQHEMLKSRMGDFGAQRDLE
jgi:hypothetical protein